MRFVAHHIAFHFKVEKVNTDQTTIVSSFRLYCYCMNVVKLSYCLVSFTFQKTRSTSTLLNFELF